MQILINTSPPYVGTVKVNNAAIGSVTVDHNTHVNVVPGYIELLANVPAGYTFDKWVNIWDKPNFPGQTAIWTGKNPIIDSISDTATNESYTAVFKPIGSNQPPPPPGTSDNSSLWTIAGLAAAAYILLGKKKL